MADDSCPLVVCMPSGSDKWIRSVKENPAGKVVADPEGNRWQWQSDEETARQLKKLNNDELAIEQTDIRLKRGTKKAATSMPTRDSPMLLRESPTRDPGGGFNPYDNSGKPRRR